MKMRLDRYLTASGLGTRSAAKKEIQAGNVSVNGTAVRRPETKIDTEKDRILFCGKTVSYEKYVYYMLNKPAGVVSATEDRFEKTVLDLVDEQRRGELFPVGRLDKDTEGLLLITNDGQLAHRLLSPRKHVDKVYFARINGHVTQQDIREFAQGLDIGDDRPTLPADLVVCSAGSISEILLTIREGRFHQVKRMFRAVEKEVIYLKRLRMGPIELDDSLSPGEYRRLTEEEVRSLCSQGKRP